MQMSSTFYTNNLTARTIATWTPISSFHYHYKVDHELNYIATWLVVR